MTGEIKRRAGAVSALGGNRFRVIASTPGVARDGMAIPTEAWDTSNFEANPILLWSHKRDDLDAVLGRATVRKTAHALEADIEFLAPGVSAFADKVSALWDAGVLRAVSVGAAIRATEPAGDQLRDTDCELLEVSCVPVGGDALALARSIDFDIDPQTAEAVFNLQPEAPKTNRHRNRFRALQLGGRK
jgi:hypothetical protein